MLEFNEFCGVIIRSAFDMVLTKSNNIPNIPNTALPPVDSTQKISTIPYVDADYTVIGATTYISLYGSTGMRFYQHPIEKDVNHFNVLCYSDTIQSPHVYINFHVDAHTNKQEFNIDYSTSSEEVEFELTVSGCDSAFCDMVGEMYNILCTEKYTEFRKYKVILNTAWFDAAHRNYQASVERV